MSADGLFTYTYRRCWVNDKKGWEVWLPRQQIWMFLNEEGTPGERDLLRELGLLS